MRIELVNTGKMLNTINAQNWRLLEVFFCFSNSFLISYVSLILSMWSMKYLRVFFHTKSKSGLFLLYCFSFALT